MRATKYLYAALSAAVAASGVAVLTAAPAQSSVSAKISTFPYSQDWSTLTTTSTWADFPGVEGFSAGTTIAASNLPNSTDVGSLTAEGTLVSNLVARTGTALPNADSNGGVLTYGAAANKTVALSATGTVTTPMLVLRLDTTGKSGIGVAYDVQDLDSSATDDQPTRVALQYRVGTTGSYTNVPAAYLSDATTVGNTSVGSTPVAVTLPAAVDDEADVYLRVITLDNASGSNEHIGIDNISITTGGGDPDPEPLAGNSQADITTTVGALVAAQLGAAGGTEPYAWSATGLPGGMTLSAAGALSGSPTTEGTYPVTATISDSSDPAQTDEVAFTITVGAAPTILPIATLQGDGARSPYAGTGTAQGPDTVTTEGVVTGIHRDPAFANSGFDGFYLQTGGTGAGTDATPGASDGIFVYGASAIPADLEIGDSVRVTGRVSEFFDFTELNAFSNGVVALAAPLDPVTPLVTSYPTTDAGREALESMLLAPTDEFTVSNAYSTNQYGEIGLATGDEPLKQPTEFADATDAAALQAIRDENAERAVTLDDGTGVNYLGNQTTKGQPVPYLTAADGNANPAPPRVGAAAVLQAPVLLDYRNDTWKFQPTSPVYKNGADVVTFEDTRAGDQFPQNVGGDLKIATFNVLNYFNTTGEAFVASGPQQDPPLNTACSYYTDRQSNRIGNNTCGVVVDGENLGNGPRGAATAASLARQEAKLVHTINALGADIIALEEIENSIKLPGETNRDDALANLVRILNDAAGAGTWAYVKSPGSALTASAVAEQDLIRSAYIYKRGSVETIGQSDLLFGTTEFANAREPLAQAFKAKGAPDSDGFVVIANHFKSKGDNQSPRPPAEGDNANNAEIGAFNGDRVRQATRLVEYADDFAAARDLDAVFLVGDFNSYTREQPVGVITGAGYTLVESDTEGEESYSYDGLSGSLDHVFANAEAAAMVTGADIWEINANEAASFQYSRFNYNVTDFWLPNQPWATSDHNPEIVGIDVPDVTPTSYKEIQVIGTNDFHGRLLPDGGNAAGAAPFATAVEEFRTENPNTLFVAAGDLVGASTFESFIQDDEPTIDALNAMGLDVSAAGNHEFDRGYDDLANRIRTRADWDYIAANLAYDDSIAAADRLAETWTTTVDGVQVGFVGAVTEDLPALVNPTGIDGITVTDIVEATNTAAGELRDAGAEIVILLVHEGAPTTDCTSPSFTDPATVWGNIVQNTSSEVDAIVSGHTHLAYNCRFAVADWVLDGRDVNRRPVVSAGQYGTNLNQLVFKFDEATGDLAAISQDVVATAGVGYAADPTVQAIVDDAVDYADEAGSAVLGQMEGPFKRASYTSSSGATENRGGESTLANQVAEVQRWATDEAGIDTDIAFMNPGGLRDDMIGTANAVDPALQDLTYRQAADVQPFANTLVNLDLTGAQLETVLEQQWQRTATGGVPSRPFLRLGVSEGFTYTYTETPVTVSVPNAAPVNTFSGEVTGMWLDGEPIDPAATYSVTVNSFLGGGGDNFWEFANGSGKVDTGQIDLQAMVDYMAQYDPTASEDATPLRVDFSQRAVEVTFPNDAPDVYAVGDTLSFDVASWSMSAAGDVQDTELQLRHGEDVLGTFPVTNTAGTAPYDNTGTASVVATVPVLPDGRQELTLVGPATGTSIPVVIDVDVTTDVQILGTNDFHGRLLADGALDSQFCGDVLCPAALLSGTVKQMRADNPNTVFVAAGDLIGASTFESFIQDDVPTIEALNEAGLEVSAAGNHEFDQGYEDLVGRVQDLADWQYLATNVEEPAGRDDLAETWTKDFGGIEVGFVGAVTEELPSLVTPSGIAGLTVTDIVDATNDAAAELKAGGADLVVLLVHEGSSSTECTSDQFTDTDTVWGNITQNVSADVDAIVSGHTHLAYDCSFPVTAWESEGRAVTRRPVVSAGQYGQNLNKLVFTVDNATGDVLAKTQSIVALNASSPSDPVVEEIVDEAKVQANVLGAVKIGEIAAPFNRAKLANGTTENRGGESTLGNQVAEVQRWATASPETGSAQIAFMNSGGLRADMVGTVNGGARDLSFKQAAVVQPFANTLVNMDLTGAQIETVLEQQWQRSATGTVPTRPFIRLGVSKGFTYTYTEQPVTIGGVATFTGEITGMWLDGVPIDPAASYSVTVNSFLSTGGDNFREFANGTGRADTGKVDLAAMVDYMEQFASSPLPVDSGQRAVRVEFPIGAPSTYLPGDEVAFNLGSWSMTAPGDVTDSEVVVRLGGQVVGRFPVDNTRGTAVYDPYGTAAVRFALPAGAPDGPTELTLTGEQTGTVARVPIVVQPSVRNQVRPVITGTAKLGGTLTASAGTWSPVPTTLSYRWFADGAEISGETGTTLKLRSQHVGQRITVEVRATAAGYVDGVAVSTPTDPVVKGGGKGNGKG